MNNQASNLCCAEGQGCQPVFKTKHLIALVLVAGAIALGVLSILRERIVNPGRYQVSFTGEGRVFAKPDIAQIQLAVKTDRSKDAVAAVKSNTEKMNAVIAKLKELGLEDKDIKTISYNLNPDYEYPPNGQRTLAGYNVYQEVTIKVRDLNKIGSVIESATAAGANQAGNVSFTIDDLTELKKQARAEAVVKAKEQARSMAGLTGIKLGKLIGVWENANQPVPYYDSRDYAAKSLELGIGGGALSVPQIQTGENEVKLEITLTYEVK